MASAVLASQNESSFGHMGKIPYSNPHLNGNPNPKKRQKQFHHNATNGVLGRYHSNDADSQVVTQTASDDGYSFNQTSTSRRDVSYSAYLTFNVASYTKAELLDLRKRLSSELGKVRDLQDRIDSGEFNRVENPRSQPKLKKIPGNKRSVAALGPVPKKSFNVNVNDTLGGAFNCEDLLKDCSKIVAKLIKHKFGYVFKTPVDAVGLGLHDYHSIVKRPMDLGTVKSNLAKSLYASPIEFAADVRLIFNNAMLYNPKNDPYNVMAEQMLARFEDLFKLIQEKINISVEHRDRGGFHEFRVNDELQFGGTGELQGSSLSNRSNQILSSAVKSKKAKLKSVPVPVEQAPVQAHSSASTPSNPPVPQVIERPPEPEELFHSPVRAPTFTAKEQKIGRGLKLPKPRAKDPNKREMTMEEKQKLGLGLQGLPQEKMPQLIHIVRKRSTHLAQDGDEIELDIEALDTETVWELDRFVTNWKKMESKIRRQALMVSNNLPTGDDAPDMGEMSDKNDDDPAKKFRENEDEDVDIDDDMPETTFPPVEIEKDEGPGVGGQDPGRDQDERGNASSSSSSSGSSSSDSSSSDSDSGSSSGSDSDAADDAQS